VKRSPAEIILLVHVHPTIIYMRSLNMLCVCCD